MRTLIAARHAHAASNVGDIVNAVPPGGGLSATGVEQAQAFGRLLEAEVIDLAVSSRLLRTQETLAEVVRGNTPPAVVEPLFDEIGFGAFEGAALSEYRAWAWANGPEEPCPGGGESRADAAVRVVDGLEWLLVRPEETVVVVGHALLVRYLLDAASGIPPAARVAAVPHATPFRLDRDTVCRAIETLRLWLREPRFVDRSSVD